MLVHELLSRAEQPRDPRTIYLRVSVSHADNCMLGNLRGPTELRDRAAFQRISNGFSGFGACLSREIILNRGILIRPELLIVLPTIGFLADELDTGHVHVPVLERAAEGPICWSELCFWVPSVCAQQALVSVEPFQRDRLARFTIKSLRRCF